MSGPSAEEPVRPDIVGFLRARLAEDEAAALTVPDDLREIPLEQWVGVGPMEHVARWSAARVLREVEAKRAIIEFALNLDYRLDEAELLRLLALPFQDHPDFDPAWRPS